MNKKIITVLLLIINGLTSFSQEETDTIRKKGIYLHDYSILPCVGTSSLPFSDATMFQKLAPNSILLTKDLSNYSHSGISNLGHRGGMYGSIIPSFTLMAGFKFNKMEHTSLRIGVGYSAGVNFLSDYILETTSIYDTLLSAKTGQKIYAQAKNSDRYSMKTSYEQLRLDISYLLKTKLDRRFSFYTGLGLTAGFSFNNVTEIKRISQVNYDGYKDNLMNIGTESFLNRNVATFSMYIPLGLNFRVGHRSEFFKRISLFAETRPAVNLIDIPELKTYKFVSIQHGIGLKIKF